MNRRRETVADDSARLTDVVYTALLNAVLARELAPGTKLSELVIGDTFGVSRTVVRAALNRLHSEAIVDFERNRGAFIASPSKQEAHEIFDLRTILETEVVRRLAGQLSSTQLHRLEHHQQAQRQAHLHDDQSAVSLSAVDFHVVLADLLGDAVLRAQVGNLIGRSALVLSLYGKPLSHDCGLAEHDRLVDALKAGDVDGAVGLMRQHLGDVIARTLQADQPTQERSLQSILGRHTARRKPSGG